MTKNLSNRAIAKEVAIDLESSDALNYYLAQLRETPLLSKEQEEELFFRLQNADDMDAAKKLVMSHLRFVVHIAKTYKGYGLPLLDIIQEGNVGLMKAVKKFDPSKKKNTAKGFSRASPPVPEGGAQGFFFFLSLGLSKYLSC